jgi:tetratricopeptide (TPR) repeat protein
VRAHKEGLNIARKLGDRRSESWWIGFLGDIASRRGDFPEAPARYEEALRIGRELGERRLEGWWVSELGGVARCVGDYTEARIRYEEALSIARTLGDRRLEDRCVGGLGDVALEGGDYAAARRRYLEAVSIARELGERRSESEWVGGLGSLATRLGDYTEARARLGEALGIARGLGEHDGALFETCGGLLAGLGRCEDAALLLAAADELSTRAHKARSAWEQARYDATLATCRGRLDEGPLTAASQRGRTLNWAATLDTAIEVLGRISK